MAWNDFVGKHKVSGKQNKLLDSKRIVSVTNVNEGGCLGGQQQWKMQTQYEKE